MQFGGNGPTCVQNIPNLLLPLERVVRRSPKLSDSAERIVTLPEPPVEAYVPPFGLRDTDHANEIKALMEKIVRFQSRDPNSTKSLYAVCRQFKDTHKVQHDPIQFAHNSHAVPVPLQMAGPTGRSGLRCYYTTRDRWAKPTRTLNRACVAGVAGLTVQTKSRIA